MDMSTVSDAYEEDNRRRIERIDTWIRHAVDACCGIREKAGFLFGFIPVIGHALAVPRRNEHIRFLYYWIAYEAAYKQEQKSDSERSTFHKRVANRERILIRRVLREYKNNAIALLELRQANRDFWYKPDNSRYPEGKQSKDISRQDWENWFEKEVSRTVNRLDYAVCHDDVDAVAKTLNDLFQTLSVVRNQIVHGGSAGKSSYGRNQVILGLKLLAVFIPIFRDCIDTNLPRLG